MNRLHTYCVVLVCILFAPVVSALPRTFQISEIFSNADGTLQFIVVIDNGERGCDAGENLWAGEKLLSSGAAPTRTYVFPRNLSTCQTSGHSILIATEGFAALGVITPDFVIPDGFVQIPSGQLNFAGVSNVIYTALPSDGITAIDNAGMPMKNVARNFAGASYSLTGIGGVVAPVNVVEYYNASLDHYFITWIAAEQANLDAGNTPTKWVRTGYSFKAHTTPATGTSPVCRYYLPPAFGDSHFFGRGTAECNATGAAHPAFVLEDPQFMAMFLPVLGECATGTTPIYRVFSNRPDANHRYMTDRTLRDQMVARGWLAEGDGPDLVVMCAP